MNSLSKFVVSTTPKNLEGHNSTLITGNVPGEVTRLKQQPGQDILVAGSGQLVRTLMRHDLIDENRLMVHPVVLGSGRRRFADGTGRKDLRLVGTKTFSTGTIVVVYGPARKERS